MDMPKSGFPTRERTAARNCAVAGVIVIAIAGAAAPFYVRAPLAPWIAAVLLAIAAAIAIALLWLRRSREDTAAAPTLATTTAKVPLELAPEELRRQLDTLRHTQGELLLAKQTAEAAMMAKGEFLATMSHEIRTPLNGVLPLLELVLATTLAPDQRDYLSTAHASARELLRIVDAILDYSKLDAERLELETTGLNLRELVSAVAQLMQRNAEAKGLRLSVTIDPNVRLAVRGDPVRLRQVLTNLVSNAIKFTERGGVHIQVSKRSETRDHHEIVFAVRDSGIGIASDVAAKLFRPFSQADASTTRVFGGTGLGLAICKRLVDLMGGHLGVKSEPGKGSLFWFSVPLLKAVGDVQVRRSLDSIRALALVEDETLLRRLQHAVTTLGIELTPVRTYADALSALRASANMGERWRHALLIVDAATFKPILATLVRNVLKDASLAHVRILLTSHGGMDLPQDPRLRTLAGSIAEESLRTTLEPMFGVQEPVFARSDPPPEAMLQLSPASADTPLRGRVLLVEDNTVNRRVAQRLLDLYGLDVTAVNDGREAVAPARARSIRSRADGLPDAGDGRLYGYTAVARARKRIRCRTPADRRHDSQRDGRRSRALPRRRHGRLHLQAARPHRADANAAAVAAGSRKGNAGRGADAGADRRCTRDVVRHACATARLDDAHDRARCGDHHGPARHDGERIRRSGARLPRGCATAAARYRIGSRDRRRGRADRAGAHAQIEQREHRRDGVVGTLAQHRARGARRHSHGAGRACGRHPAGIRARCDGAVAVPRSRRRVSAARSDQLSTLVCRYGTTPSSSTRPSCVSSQSMCSSSDSRMLAKRSRLT